MSSNESDAVSESQKKLILKNEAHAIALTKQVVAYSRRGEEEDTLIIRDLSNRSAFDHFGVKGIANLERLFFTTLGLMNEHCAVLAKRARYGEGEDLRQLFCGLNDDDREKMRCALAAMNADNDKRKRVGVVVDLKRMDTCPQLTMFRYNDSGEGKLQYGIYLFVRPAIKLVRYMNTRFAFSKSECLSLENKELPALEKYTNDNFFF